MARQRGRRGDGTVYYRQDRGRWLYEVALPDATGRLRRHAWSFPTRDAALRKQRAVLGVLDRGQRHADERQTLQQFVERYRGAVLAGQARNTQRAVRTALDRHLLPAFGRTRLVHLQPAAVQAFYTRLVAAGYQPSTVRQIHGVLRAVLNQAVAWGDLAANPLARVRVPRVPPRERRILQPAEVQRVLTAAQGDPLEALVWLAATTGMREGELLGLYWADVNLARGTLTVQRQRIRGDDLRAPKTAAGRRTLPLAAPVRAALRRHQARGTNGPLIFHTRTGRPLGPSWLIARWWYPLLDRAGVRRVRLHDLRHGAGSFLLWLGMDIAQVSRLLGHSSVAVTLAIYAHVVERGEHELMDKLAALIQPAEDASPSDSPSIGDCAPEDSAAGRQNRED